LGFFYSLVKLSVRVRRPLLVTILFLSSAVYLHVARGSAPREWATALLGYEWRAVIEHTLVSMGLPLMLALLFLAALRNLGKRPASVRAQQIMLICYFALFAIGYATASYFFEWDQTFVSVYGGAARGYFQYAQWNADLVGLALATGYMLFELAAYRCDTLDSSLQQTR